MRRNKFVCMILSFALLISCVGAVYAEGESAKDAYTEMYFADSDEYSGMSVNTKYNCLGVAKENSRAVCKNVDFGATAGTFIDVTYAVSDKFAGGTLAVYIDSDDDENNLIAEVSAPTTGSMTDFSMSHTELLVKVSGTHDICFKVTSKNFGNLKSFKFTNNAAEVEQAAAEFVEKINSPEEDYSEVFGKYAETLAIDVSEFAGAEDFVYGYIKANITYANLEMILLAITEAINLNGINSAEDADAIKDILDGMPELLSSVKNSFKEAYNDLDKIEVCGVIKDMVQDTPVTNKTELAATFETAVCKTAYAGAADSETLGAFLKSYGEYLALDKYSDYKTMSERSQNKILETVLGTEFGNLGTVFAEAVDAEAKRLETDLRSAYDEIQLMDADFMSDGLTKNTNFSCISNTWSGKYLQFNELNFGTEGARAIDFTYGATSEYHGQVRFYIDSISSENQIASLMTEDTGEWHNWETVTVPLSQTLTGVHDVFVQFGAVVGDVKAMKFYTQKIVSAEGTRISLYSGMAETENILSADSLSAEAAVEVIDDGKTMASLLINAYDENGTPLMSAADEKVLANNITNEFEAVLKFTPKIKPTYASAFMIDDGFMFYGTPSFVGTEPKKGTSSDKKLRAVVENTSIILSGTADGEYVAAAVRTKTGDRADFKNYSFIAPVKCEDGTWYTSFVAPDTMKTGEYIACVFDGNGGFEETEIKFVSDDDIKWVIETLNDATESNVQETVEKNSYYLNVDTSAAENDSWIYYNVYKKIPFASLADFQSTYAFLCTVSKLAESEDAESFIDENAEILGISADTTAEKYRNNKNVKNGAAKRTVALGKENTASKSEFVKQYKISACMQVLSDAVSWGTVDEALTDFNDVLNLDKFDVYETLSADKKANICGKLLNLDESKLTANGTKGIFETAYTAETSSNAGYTPSGGSGGSNGGGGGGGSSYQAPTSAFSASYNPLEAEENKNSVKFTDIDSCAWAKEQIVNFWENGYINGKSEEIFAPFDNVTRAEFIKILCLVLNITSDGECDFADLSKDDWSYPYIAAAYAKQIVSGYEDGTIRGEDFITREEMAVMAYRAALIMNIEINEKLSNISFIDGENISSWAYLAVMSLARADVLHGVGGDEFSPKRNSGRAEAVVFLANLESAAASSDGKK